MNHSIDGVRGHIIHELVVVFVGHAPEPEFDVLKCIDVFQVIVQVRKRDYRSIDSLCYAPAFPVRLFLSKNFNLFIQTGWVFGILHRKPGLVGLPYRHFTWLSTLAEAPSGLPSCTS